MIFHSLTYLVFLALVLALYWSLPRRGQNLMLIFASYIFYGWGHPWFLLPLWASTLVDYGCARAIERFPAQRRAFLIISIGASIALLGTFKYYDFALENINAILANFGQDPIRNALRHSVLWHLGFWEWTGAVAVFVFLCASVFFTPPLVALNRRPPTLILNGRDHRISLKSNICGAAQDVDL